MIKFEFYEPANLQQQEIKSLWLQDINMDNWDYMLFFENEDDFSIGDEIFKLVVHPKNFNVGNLLSGCCANIWYPVKNFHGRKGIIGIAYHS